MTCRAEEATAEGEAGADRDEHGEDQDDQGERQRSREGADDVADAARVEQFVEPHQRRVVQRKDERRGRPLEGEDEAPRSSVRRGR